MFETLPTCRSEVVKNVDALFGKVSTDSFSSISQTPFFHPKINFPTLALECLHYISTHSRMKTNRPVQIMFLVLYFTQKSLLLKEVLNCIKFRQAQTLSWIQLVFFFVMSIRRAMNGISGCSH